MYHQDFPGWLRNGAVVVSSTSLKVMKKNIKKLFKGAFALIGGILAGFVALIALFAIWSGDLGTVEVLGIVGLCASSMALFLTSMEQKEKTCRNLVSKS
jgi:hypothetical protein